MKAVKIAGISVLVLILIAIGGGIYMFGLSLDRKVSPTDEQESYAFLFDHDPNLKIWVDSLRQHSALHDTTIVAEDGTKLHALYIRAAVPSPNTALLIHGYTDNSIRMLMIAHLYNNEMGYNVLLPDLRAHGKSGGDYIQMGWRDRLDILRWIDVAKSIYGDTTAMVLHGISMGGATTMMTSGESLPQNVKCFVEDCGYTSVWDEFSYKLKKQYSLPSFPLLHIASWYSQLKLGWNFREASAIEQLKKCKLPMFFIHGDKDTYVPTYMVNQLYDAKQGDKELWITPNTGHANSYWDYTQEYVSKTKSFVGKYISRR